MSSKKNKAPAKEMAVGDTPDGNSEVNLLRAKLEDHEKKHITIKAEFEALKKLHSELCDRHDKYIKELKLDMRIQKKDIEKKEESNRFLREEKRELRDKLSALQISHDQLKEQMVTKDQQIEQLMKQVDSLNKDLSSKLTDQKVIKESFEERIKCLTSETKSLREQLRKELNWKDKAEDTNKKSDQLSKEIEALRRQMMNSQDELSGKNQEILAKDKEVHQLKSRNKVMREEMEKMDRQLEQFKAKYQCHKSTEKKFVLEKDTTHSQIQKLNHELDVLRSKLQSETKEKDEILKLLEEREHRLNDMSKTESERFQTLHETIRKQTDKIGEYEDRMRALEDLIEGKNEIISGLDEKISYLEEESFAIKEEAAKHITTIGELKAQNNKLTVALEDLMVKQEGYQQRVDSLHHELDIKEEEMNKERIASTATIAQHQKLIEFLQDRVESLEKQKKPFISLTPTKKVDNSPHPMRGFEVNNLDKLLAEEKTKNRRLIEELNRLKNEVKSSIKSELYPEPTEHFRKPLFADNRRRMENEVQRTDPPPERWHSNGSAGRMHHNIPHRMVELTNRIPNTRCVSCAEIIHFGKKAQKCGECGAIIHPKCAHRLPNNCGLPFEMMQQIFNSSQDVKSYYPSQPVDDVVTVHPEPSAPEETLAKYEDNCDSSATTDNNDTDSAFLTRAMLETPIDWGEQEIRDICENKENSDFSYTDSLLEIIDNSDDQM